MPSASVTPMFSLASSPTMPSAGTVNVAFNGTGNTVTLPTNADVSVDKAKMKILFHLASSNLPAGATATIAGIEFSKPGEPAGTYAPTNIFEDEGTITVAGAAHTVYGKWKDNQHWLKLIDDDPATGEQDYGYKVWIAVTSGGTTNYYASPDPQVKNKPTTG